MPTAIEASIPYENPAKSGGNYRFLDQTGPFAFPQDITHPMSEVIGWMKKLNTGDRSLFRGARKNILQLFDARNLMAAKNVLNNPSKKDEARIQGYRALAEMYGLFGSDSEIADKIGEYARNADDLVEKVAHDLGDNPSRGKAKFDFSNEVAGTSNPLELIGIIIDRTIDQKIRFEALRKISLMMLAADIDQHEREETERRLVVEQEAKKRVFAQGASTDQQLQPTVDLSSGSNFFQFQAFLNEHVFKKRTTGSSLFRDTLLVSHHSADDFRCIDTRRLPDNQAKIVRYRKPSKLTKYTELKERTFTQNGADYAVYSQPRKKDRISTMLKLIRKGETNAAGVQDYIGLMAVLDSKASVRAFVGRLTDAAHEAGLLFHIKEHEDTLDGKPYSAKNPGSSDKLKALKFIAKIGGMEIEFLIFTHDGYMDNNYRDDVSHDEFNVKRLYRSGAVALLFPEQIYPVNHEKHEISIRQKIRKEIRER